TSISHHGLGKPNERGIVRAAFVRGKIPVGGVLESSRMAVKEGELGPAAVEVGMNEVGCANGRQILAVKQPDGHRVVFHRGDFDWAITRASAVDVFVEAIMEKVVS